MKQKLGMVFLALLVIPFILAGCVDNKRLEEIEKNQKDILAKLDGLDTSLKDMTKNIAPKRRPQIDFNKVHNIPIGSSFIKGNKEAKVAIVEFSDFQCPYCSRLQPTLKEVLKIYPNDVKLVYKDFPLSFHKQAMNASKASRAAGEQGKFWEMHDLIFEKYNSLTDASFDEFAAKLNLDMEKFKSDYSSNKYDKLIQEDINLARKVGVSGTPTLYINGKRMRGRSVNDFKTMIDENLKNKG
jgi:protein-disulfide isomerase